MAARINANNLPHSLKIIVAGVLDAPRSVGQRELINHFGRWPIECLIDGGHLTATTNRDQVIVTPLSTREMREATLIEGWSGGLPISSIGAMLGMSGGQVVMRARALGIRRRGDFRGFVPAWRVRRLRLDLADAERRGLDPTEPHDTLNHPARFRRFFLARHLVWSGPSGTVPRWTREERDALRGLRDEGRSIVRMATLLNREPADVAARLVLEGRSLTSRWSKKEDEVLMEGIRQGLEFKTIAQSIPGRSGRQVKRRLRELGPSKRGKAWTEVEMTALLAGLKEGLRGKALSAKVPSRTHHAVRRRAYNILRATRQDERWCEADFHITYRAMERGESPETIALWLDREPAAVKDRIAFLSIRDRKGREPKLSGEQAREALALLHDPDVTYQQVADRYDTTRMTLSRALDRLRMEERRS